MKGSIVTEVKHQYERWPYPHIPLPARLHRDQLWQINLNWILEQSGQPAPTGRSRIWIAGCGTFQPYAFARANPNSAILATDLSETSLDIAKKRCKLHGVKNVYFSQVDLTDESQYPEKEGFDLIECYGVLMCLPDPQAVMQKLVSRLKPNGVLRLMVYTHYGRQRVFQVQKLAKLCGFQSGEKSDPAGLKELIGHLPPDHPLRYTFFSYHDSKNLEGIVDGFLHASDRGFTGIEISDLADRAGLDLAFCFHRPWGQPKEMGVKLGLAAHDTAFWLHYLDLWQELKTNFILCFVPKHGEKKSPERKGHPLFAWDNSGLGWRHRMRLLRLSKTGVKLESRIHSEPLALKPTQVKKLIKGEREALFPELEVLPPLFQGTSRAIHPLLGLRRAEKIPNPLYHHLFEAYAFDKQWNGSLDAPLPSLREQIGRWCPYARPLEDELHPIGLTPYGTYLAASEEIERNLEHFIRGENVEWKDLSFADEEKKFCQVRKFIKNYVKGAPEYSPEALRELWVLLFSHHHLFLEPGC